MSNIYQQLSLYFRQEQEVPLVTEMAETEIVEIEEKKPVTLQKKEVKIVTRQAESQSSQRQEEIKNVLQSWLTEINTSGSEIQSKPGDKPLPPKQKPVEGNCEAIQEAIDKLINSEAKLSELSNKNNKFIFVETVEDKLVEILTEGGKTNLIFCSPINQKKIILYSKQRQILLSNADKLYKKLQIGRIWA